MTHSLLLKNEVIHSLFSEVKTRGRVKGKGKGVDMGLGLRMVEIEESLSFCFSLYCQIRMTERKTDRKTEIGVSQGVGTLGLSSSFYRK